MLPRGNELDCPSGNPKDFRNLPLAHASVGQFANERYLQLIENGAAVFRACRFTVALSDMAEFYSRIDILLASAKA
jgi:hypothetical protein